MARASCLPLLAALHLMLLCCGCPKPLDRLGAERASIPGRHGGVASSERDAQTERRQLAGDEATASDSPARDEELAERIADAQQPRQPVSVEVGEQDSTTPQKPTAELPVGPQAPTQSPESAVPGVSDFLKESGQQPQAGSAAIEGLPLSSSSLAGRWQVLALGTEGQTAPMPAGEKWIFRFTEGDKVEVVQQLAGKEWRRSGSCSIAGKTLALDFTDGSSERYELLLASGDICLFTQTEPESALLYSARMDSGVKAAQIAPRYESDFGAISFSPSGPGRFRGSYGAPEGELLLSLQGSFAVGTWQQDGEEGHVIFGFDSEGFSGVWWKTGSSGIDGLWQGRSAAGGV